MPGEKNHVIAPRVFSFKITEISENLCKEGFENKYNESK